MSSSNSILLIEIVKSQKEEAFRQLIQKEIQPDSDWMELSPTTILVQISGLSSALNQLLKQRPKWLIQVSCDVVPELCSLNK